MNKKLLLAGAALALSMGAVSAQAQGIYVGIGEPAPVYAAPAPIYGGPAYVPTYDPYHRGRDWRYWHDRRGYDRGFHHPEHDHWR